MNFICNSCQREIPLPLIAVDQLPIQTGEEADRASRDPPQTGKVLLCRNPHCAAPRRMILVPTKKEAEIVGHIRSWIPVATSPLNSLFPGKHPELGDYSVAEFLSSKVPRTPDISFGDYVHIQMLRRTLDGFGREIQGAFTLFDFYCWGDHRNRKNWLLQPIEANDPNCTTRVPRFNPFCAMIRQHINKMAKCEVIRRLLRSRCPYLIQHELTSTSLELRRPCCSSCTIEHATESKSDLQSVDFQSCCLYTEVLSSLSPCYQCDSAHFSSFLDLTRDENVRTARDSWRKEMHKYVHRCWAGFEEIGCPILLHDHLVAFTMTGQIIRVPPRTSEREKRDYLNTVTTASIQRASERLGLDKGSSLALSKSCRLDEWRAREIEQGCCWLVDEETIQKKITTLLQSSELLENLAQERYAKERNLREDHFHDELYGRFEIERMSREEDTLDIVPQILCRMCEFWGFETAAYLNCTPESGDQLVLLADCKQVYSDDESAVRIPPVVFRKPEPRLGMLLWEEGPGVEERSPRCTWVPTVKGVQRLLEIVTISDLLLYATPTKFGQDVFVFHRRNPQLVSFKPRVTKPSAICLDSIRRVCSGLSKRIADYSYFRRQVRDIHTVSHTIRTPVETIRTALKNLEDEIDLHSSRSYTNLRDSVCDLVGRVVLGLAVVNAEHEALPRVRIDLLDELRRACKTYRRRFKNRSTIDALGYGSWYITVPRRFVQLLLSNAIGNAFKYSFRSRPVEISVREDPGSEETVLTVENWGYGVTEAEIPRIGELLFRGNAVQHKQGTGLGMYLIKRLMARESKFWRFRSRPSSGYVGRSTGVSFVNTLTLHLPGKEQ